LLHHGLHDLHVLLLLPLVPLDLSHLEKNHPCYHLEVLPFPHLLLD